MNALNDYDSVFRISLNFVISWKIGEDQLNNEAVRNGSKACACNTCTPCKGLCPVDPVMSLIAVRP
jgi:hypothetical protein